MADRCGRQGFLAKARSEHRIVSDEIRKNDFDRVRSFEKDVPRLKNDAHASLPETTFEQVAGVECWFTEERRRSFITILGTVIDIIWETTPTARTFLHAAKYTQIMQI